MKKQIIPIPEIAHRIFYLRGQKVMLDADLAILYGIETRALKQAVRRNFNRFPADFMFQLSAREIGTLVSQFVIPEIRKLGGATPMAFTEQGVAMLSSVLNSDRAVKVNIAIMRAFVKLREALETKSGERTRLACRRWRPRHRELFFRLASLQPGRFSAGRRKQHASRVRSPIHGR